MPTSTQPFEVLFDFTNDTADLATLQLTRQPTTSTAANGTSNGHSPLSSSVPAAAGPMIRLVPKDSVSLVLDAGTTYHYLVRQNHRKAQISIRTWRDTKCNASDVLLGTDNYTGRPMSNGAGATADGGTRPSPWTPLSQNVTVVCLPATTTSSSAYHSHWNGMAWLNN